MTAGQLFDTCKRNLGTILYASITRELTTPKKWTDKNLLETITLISKSAESKGLVWDLVPVTIGAGEYWISAMFVEVTSKTVKIPQETAIGPFKIHTEGVRAQQVIQPLSRPEQETSEQETAEHTGGSVNYYKVDIKQPVTEGIQPYTAECLDVALALGMTIPEFNMFKAIWRTAAERTLGKAKAGNNAKYDAEKTKFFADLNLRQYKEL